MIGPDLMLAEYEALPESIRATLTFTEYKWLGDAERARLIQTETEPETFDD